jgi:hypothetical protein
VAPVHGGPWSLSRGRLAGDRPERHPHACNLINGKRGRRSVGHDRATVGNPRRRRRLEEWALRTRKQAIEGEVSVVMAGGCSSSFYSGRGGGTPGRGRGKRPAVIALTPLMAGRLDEGLGSEIRGGESRRGVNTSPGISRSEVGWRGVAGGDERKWQPSASGAGR